MAVNYELVGGQQLNVEIVRDSLQSPWGFRLQGGTDFNSPLIVSKVTSCTAAEGELCRGDILLSVGGHDCTCLTHQEVLDIIVETGSQLRMTVIRGAQLVPVGHVEKSKIQVVAVSPGAKDEEEKKPIINARLADLMKTSLNMRDSTQQSINQKSQAQRILPQFRSQQGFGRASADGPAKDITAYLPHPPSKKFYKERTASGGSRASQSPSTGYFASTPTSHPDAMRSQLRDSLLRSPQGGSDRGSPAPSGLELKPTGTDGRQAVGVWNPPQTHPGGQLVHLQYNSPLNLYATHNVADSVKKMTGTKINWLNQQPSTKYLDDIRDSPTYKYVQQLDSGMTSRNVIRGEGDFEQSSTIKNLNKIFRQEGLLRDDKD